MSEQQHISLSQLQGMIKRQLEQDFPLTIWVTAEISEIKVNYSGHCYMQLVEKGAKDMPKASISAVIWRSSYTAIAAHFEAETGTQLLQGIKLLLRVSVSYHELYGLSLIINDIDPRYTLGDMSKQREVTITKLRQEGVFDMNRELDMPSVIQRIAIISSANAAGYRDFVKEIEASEFRFHLTLFDAFMQGEGAENSIIDALERVAGRLDDFDTIILIRGGGSQSDLSCFNNYRLSSHLAQFPIPVITGIGHDKDQSVADMVAHIALKTPTAVAGYLVTRMTEEYAYVELCEENIAKNASIIIDRKKRNIMRHGVTLSVVTARMTRTLELRLENLSANISRSQQQLIVRQNDKLSNMSTTLQQRVREMIARAKSRMESQLRITQGRDPQKILALGFSIVRSEGKTIKNNKNIRPGSSLDITLYEGKITAIAE